MTPTLTLAEAARMMRDAVKDRSYRATPLGLEVARYYRWKKNEWGAKKGGKVKDMTADEFKARHAAEVNLTLEEYDRYLVVERQGKRWISVPRIQVEREKREAKKAGS